MEKGELKIRINCFGRFEIYMNDEEQSMNMNSAKARELIAFLMTYKGAAVSKDVVCDALWGETPIEYSKDCLYKLVKRIRQMRIPFHLDSNRGMIRLGIDNIESDIVEFDRLLERNSIKDLESLIYLYKGSLFEEESYNWANMKAAAYDNRYMDTIYYLKDYYESNQINGKSAYYEKLLCSYL